ncbi:MAG: protein TolR [Zoogloea sp.]|nr:protein TolR [Zoogloea sp.]
MRQRRLMNQINVVPYIDVMLVLLVIFMVTAPMIQSGSVNLPSVDNVPAPPVEAAVVLVKADGDLAFKANTSAPEQFISKAELHEKLQALMTRNPAQPVVIAADKTVAYEKVMDTLNDLRNAGISKVGLQTQVGNNTR